jgi:uncharacterized protein YbjT (DUF2867 family)
MKRVLVAGATGLIGSELIKLLLVNPHIGQVVAISRSQFKSHHPKLKHLIISFEELEKIVDEFYGDSIFCCLGSTIKKTPDLQDYKRVDHDYPIKLAELSQQCDVSQFHLVSALGANPQSRQFYLRMKGETEQAIKKIFNKSLHIYQPALLTGNRLEERRFEKTFIFMMKVLNPFLVGGLKKYRSIKAATVAKAMINQTFKNLNGVHTYPSNIIKQLA